MPAKKKVSSKTYKSKTAPGSGKGVGRGRGVLERLSGGGKIRTYGAVKPRQQAIEGPKRSMPRKKK